MYNMKWREYCVYSYSFEITFILCCYIQVLGLILSSNTERNAVAGSDSSNYAGAATEARGSDYSAIARDEESQPPKDAVQDKSPTEQDDKLSQEKKLLAALLSFTMVICEKLIDADDFSNVAHVDRELLKKLIDRDNRCK